MYKFKTSKYKNALAKVPKKEGWILDLSVGSPQSHGNHIKASGAYLVYSCDTRGGGSLGVLPLEASGRIRKDAPMLHCHSEQVTDFDFSPFDDGLLATGSQDCTVKLWRLPERGLASSLSNAQAVLPVQKRRIENVQFHPTADGALSFASGTSAVLWDLTANDCVWEFGDHASQVLSVSWKEDGSLLATVSRDKMLRVLDPRSNRCVQDTVSHQNPKDGRVVWLGSSDRILTSGFDSSHQRQVYLRDVRNLPKPLKLLSPDTATGILMPLFDSDTNMLFLAGKADSSVVFLEVTDTEPYLAEASRHACEQPTKGACLIPKRAVDVMRCEVNRLMQLTSSAVVPITYQVPRKTFRDFHSDLFPDTSGAVPSMTVAQWRQGANDPVPKVNLDPSSGRQSLLRFGSHQEASSNGQEGCGPSDAAPVPAPRRRLTSSGDCDRFYHRSASVDSSATAAPVAAPRSNVLRRNSRDACKEEPHLNGTAPAPGILFGTPASPRAKTTKFQGFRTSKFRHLQGAPLPRGTHIENVRNLSTSVPDGFQVNRKRVAVALRGPGGKIAVFELSKPGRLPDGVVPVVQNGATVMDFAWDPFDVTRLAVACDDARIRLWIVPDGGLKESVTTPDVVISGHTEKIYFVKFHPVARDVLASASYDLSVRVWDLGTNSERIRLEGHADQIFSLAWSGDGRRLATACKDNRLRIYEPRLSTAALREGTGPVGNRGARVVWALDGKSLVVTGFDRVSHRQVMVYNVDALDVPEATVDIDVSPAILVPFYDDDSCTLFLTGKGDATVFAYEVCAQPPYLFPLSHHKCPNAHQALAFLPKCVCNVRDVEFARALRLTPSTIEPIAFTVPRVKTEFFQDDLFPDTKVTWEPSLSSAEWFAGKDRLPTTMSLQPDGMTPLTGNVPPPSRPKVPEVPAAQPVVNRRGKADLSTLFATMAIDDGQEDDEEEDGVDTKEWD